MNPDTLIQHLAEEELPWGAVTPPIFQSSLFAFGSYDEWLAAMREHPQGPPYHYSRVSNPTLEVLERKLAVLEGLDRAKVFSSGMAAIGAALVHCLKSGGHIVAVDTCYGPVRLLLATILTRFGVTVTYVDGLTPESVLDALQSNTAAVYLESPSSLVFRLQDLEAVAQACKQKCVVTIADNSYASPILQNPARFGVDIVVHSATKYLGGHSDIVAGVVCLSEDRFDRFLREEFTLLGAALAPLPAWLMLRGLRTLPLRMRRHEATANRMAAWLQSRSDVAHVYHASLPSHPQRELFLKQMSGSAGLLSFVPANQHERWVRSFCESLRLFRLGVSWGGFESLVVALQLTDFSPGLSGWLVRLYCGLEDPEDLIADLAQAFDRAAGA